ncbi:MAG: aspartate--tRNA ligase [Clostridiales bacterium]|nr:aspartate--tRNA ligase [Candidatus Coliplasma caballi]
MAELLGTDRRTHYCGDLRREHAGQKVCVMGWVKKRRDLGNLMFIDLRDRSGFVQLAFDDTTDPALFEKASGCRNEFVLCAKGEVRVRSSINTEIPTGEVEILVDELKVLGESETPPFEIIDDCKTGEDVRLKYRYLDLRRSKLQQNILFRHRVAKVTRDYFDENGFVEIETPYLIRSTPEGARDYLVPSRVHQGSFYALPQSPQLYKQLSMVAGFDRYFQIARCFRDEDLRADRQPEFTQIDLEMSFVDMEDIFKIAEGYIHRLFKETLNVDIPIPLPRYTYKEVMERFGSDKPDMRFGMEIHDLSDAVKGCGFSVFTSALEEGGSVRSIVLKGAADKFGRKDIDKLVDYAKGCGAKGVAWVRRAEQTSSSFAKFMTEDEMNRIYAAAECDEGDILLVMADADENKLLPQLGQLRLEAANRLGIKREGYSFLWVVEFPFFEYDRESGEWLAMHHPFTAIMDDCLPYLESDKGRVRAKCYDMVLNGIELSSGSIRITDPVLQAKIFELLGLSDEEAHAKFGYLLDAFRYGAPPHGGMALGLDRLVMQMLGAETLRDVVAFPKVQNASELMTGCPAEVPEQALRDLGLHPDQIAERK